jgi:hypothetical protein
MILNDILDVVITNPSNSNPLVYDYSTSTWKKGTNYLTLDGNEDTSYLSLDTTNGLTVNTGSNNTFAEYAADGISIYDNTANTMVTLSAGNGLNITDSSNNYANLSTTSIRFSTPENAESYYINPLSASVGQVFAVVPNPYSEPGGTFSPTTLNLDFLSDVSASAPAVDDVLKWDGANWVNGVGGGATTSASVSVNTEVTIDSFDAATNRSAEFTVQLTQGSKYTMFKALVLHDGTTAQLVQYGVIEIGSPAIALTLSSVVSDSVVLLNATIDDADMTSVYVKVLKTTIAI